ncbi:hypothetical protein BD413DRAFT_520664 [Trametes elegans]|nr:hypothetical protein BD413DRAFT_520664 [Trametes elegans]
MFAMCLLRPWSSLAHSLGQCGVRSPVPRETALPSKRRLPVPDSSYRSPSEPRLLSRQAAVTMSSDDSAYLVFLVETIYQSYVHLLLLYDWAVSLDREVALVWRGRTNLASVLYVLGRVVGPLSYVLSLVLFYPVSDKGLHSCQSLMYAGEVASLLPYVFWGLFSAFRAHALSWRSAPIAALVMALNLVPVACNIYVQEYTSTVANPAVVLRIIILSECILIGLTWRETGLAYPSSWAKGSLATARGASPSVREVLFVSGAVALTLNVLTLVLTKVGPNADQAIELFAYFRDALTSIVISRFLLDLLDIRRTADMSFQVTTGGALGELTSNLDDVYASPAVWCSDQFLSDGSNGVGVLSDEA